MRDNQPKHRQMRKEQRRLARHKAWREGLPAMLVVCEGRETEPNYILGLCEQLGVNTAAITLIRGDTVTDPAGLVRKAQERFQADGYYDRVYVVCDGAPGTLARARQMAEKTLKSAEGKKTHVELIASCPSIEYWLLLHFEYTARPFTTAAEVTASLRAHVTDYAKNDPEIFRKVAVGFELACRRAVQLKADLAASGATAPDTDMHRLAEQLGRMTRTKAHEQGGKDGD
jgi:hypothetical protein